MGTKQRTYLQFFLDLRVRSLFIGVRGFLRFIFGNFEDQVFGFVD
jgi:hypothetical protein